MARTIKEVQGHQPRTLARARKQTRRTAENDPHKGEVLIRDNDRTDIKYQRLLEKAKSEGRINSPHRCHVCGSGYLTKVEANNCCRVL
jgi:rubrerythrin